MPAVALYLSTAPPIFIVCSVTDCSAFGTAPVSCFVDSPGRSFSTAFGGSAATSAVAPTNNNPKVSVTTRLAIGTPPVGGRLHESATRYQVATPTQ